MRLRHKPKAVAALPQHQFYIKDPRSCKGIWQQQFNKVQPLSLELGCGFGKFSTEFSLRNPDKNLIAVDKCRDVLVGSCRLISDKFDGDVKNLRVCNFDAYDIENIIDISDSIENIFIFFCNPWPKRTHNRRRLTYPTLLEYYRKFLSPNATLYFKTDDKELYHHSLKYFEQCNLTVVFKTEQLSETPEFELLSIMTEYEQKFRGLGQPIYAAVVSFATEKQSRKD